MAHLEMPPTGATDLSRAVFSIRKRLGLSQAEFGRTLLGKLGNSSVSRWESGERRRPDIISLIALLKLSETPEERAPIIEALDCSGHVDEQVERLRSILSSFPMPGATPSKNVAFPTTPVSGRVDQTASSGSARREN